MPFLHVIIRFTPLALLSLLAIAVVAQQLPQTNPSTQDCTDPAQAESPQCANQNQVNPSSINPFANGGQTPQSVQPETPSNYNDLENPQRRAQQPYQSAPRNFPEPLTEYQKFAASTTGEILPVFGADLFRNVPSTFAPLAMTPVPADYVVGPGDELRIRVWGQVSFASNLAVDRSGEIYLPHIGPVHVAGIPFSGLQDHLRTAIGRVSHNFDLTVDLGMIRSIQVYVTGQARRPGLYTVSALSTLVDALFASGGPSMHGSMRDIQLRRENAIVADFDLYDLLTRGDKSKDKKLLSGDVIFIPPVGPEIALTGSVRNPAIYEIRPGETLGNLLSFAGGVTAVASGARISIDRIDDRRDRHTMDVANDASGLSIPLADGDMVRVSPIVPAYQKTVTLRGNTANPGRFAWHPGMRVLELIPDKDSLITRNYWWKRVQEGLPAPEFEPLTELADLRQPQESVNMANPAAVNRLQQQSQYPNRQYPYSTQQYPSYSAQQNPFAPQQQNPYAPQLYPYDAQQNPPNPDYDYDYLSPNYYDQSSPPPNQNQTNQMSGPYGQNGQYGQYGQQSQNQRSSTATLATEDSLQYNQYLASQYPGAQRTTVRIPAPEIDWNYAVIERLDRETLRTNLIPFDLGKLVLQHDASQDIELQPGDVISIFSQADIRVPLTQQTKLVRLEGEFVHSGTYSAQPGETLHQLVERAGGFTPGAYPYGSEFTRISTRMIQQARIDEYVQGLETDIQRGDLAAAASGNSSGGDPTSAQAAQLTERDLINRLRRVRATGRIVLEFKPDSSGVASIPDIPLENGDVFIVPSVPSNINVVGAVYDQNSFLYHGSGRVGTYLQMAGGPNRTADRRHEFVIRADGEVISRNTVHSAWGDEFDHLRLYPGDTIVVPDKSFHPAGLRNAMEWSTMFSQLALGAAYLTILP